MTSFTCIFLLCVDDPQGGLPRALRLYNHGSSSLTLSVKAPRLTLTRTCAFALSTVACKRLSKWLTVHHWGMDTQKYLGVVVQEHAGSQTKLSVLSASEIFRVRLLREVCPLLLPLDLALLRQLLVAHHLAGLLHDLAYGAVAGLSGVVTRMAGLLSRAASPRRR